MGVTLDDRTSDPEEDLYPRFCNGTLTTGLVFTKMVKSKQGR